LGQRLIVSCIWLVISSDMLLGWLCIGRYITENACMTKITRNFRVDCTWHGIKPVRLPSKCEVEELRNIGEYLDKTGCKWKNNISKM
jgi:hypothetical protein